MDTQQRRHIAQAIKTARLRHGWTTVEAATRLDTSDANWSRWETGHATPRPATLLAIGELLELPEGWWELPEDEPTTTDAEVMLERITAELAEQRRLIEQMYERLAGTDAVDRVAEPAPEPERRRR